MPQVLEREQITSQQPVRRAPVAPTAPPSRPKRKRWPIATVAAVLLIAAVAVAWRSMAKAEAAAYSAASVERGDVARSITATGKVQALTTVQVGTQVSGTLSDIYVDYNSKVTKGQIIARLDPSQLQAQLTQAQANFTSAQMSVQTGQSAQAAADAGVEAASANLDRLQAVVDDAQRNFDRTRELVAAGVAPRQQVDTMQASLAQALAQKQQGIAQLTQARAQAQSARSQVAQARAQVAQSAASVQLASLNLEKSIIKAPIDGVIVARSVDPGQTVAASFQAPVLFLIANDLTRMQVLADIDEADIGQLKTGSPVKFTVDAFPSDTFEGHISQVRLAPQTVQNVVTYTAVIDVENPEQKLKPGMTANVTVTVDERKNVLTVPNAALRFRPEGQEAPRGPAVWRVEGQALKPVPVRTGLTNGVDTEVVGGSLREGDTIAVAAQNTQAGGARPQQQSSPLGMRPPRTGGRR